MMELIFVIVILGIIAGGTFIQISTIYEDMIQKQGSSELESETKVTIEQLASRLGSSGSIIKSLVGLTGLDGTGCYIIDDTVDINTSKAQIAAWIGKSDESNIGLWDTTISDYRGWSGFVDVNGSSFSSIATPGSKLDFAEIVLDDLTGQTNSFSQASNSPIALYFAEEYTQLPPSTTCGDFGLDTAHTPTKMHKVKRNGVDKMDFENPPVSEISNEYSLSHSAYAIKLENIDPITKIGVLKLYSFRPWLGESATHANAKVYTLGKNIKEVVIQNYSGLIRINVVAEKIMPGGYPITIRKEKSVF